MKCSKSKPRRKNTTLGHSPRCLLEKLKYCNGAIDGTFRFLLFNLNIFICCPPGRCVCVCNLENWYKISILILHLQIFLMFPNRVLVLIFLIRFNSTSSPIYSPLILSNKQFPVSSVSCSCENQHLKVLMELPPRALKWSRRWNIFPMLRSMDILILNYSTVWLEAQSYVCVVFFFKSKPQSF